jgi:hypothetical protein
LAKKLGTSTAEKADIKRHLGLVLEAIRAGNEKAAPELKILRAPSYSKKPRW